MKSFRKNFVKNASNFAPIRIERVPSAFPAQSGNATLFRIQVDFKMASNRNECFVKSGSHRSEKLPILGEKQSNFEVEQSSFKATFHLTISMRGQRATGKIQRNNYHHGSCGTSLASKTSSVPLIFTQGTHRNVKNR